MLWYCIVKNNVHSSYGNGCIRTNWFESQVKDEFIKKTRSYFCTRRLLVKYTIKYVHFDMKESLKAQYEYSSDASSLWEHGRLCL